jgi:long-chain acyl-CoA synthetase
MLKFLNPSLSKQAERVWRESANKIAIEWIGGAGAGISKTYAEFSADVQGARESIRARIHAEKIVATVAGNTYPHLVFIWATWLEGLTLCPLNPDEGPERVARKIRQLGAPSLMIGAANMAWAPARSPRDFEPFPESRPMNLIFTSGSTGYGKIVEQTEAQVLANADALIDHHRGAEGLAIGTPLPVYHVNALCFSVLVTLLTGGRLVLFEKFQPLQMLEAVDAKKIEILSVMPLILNAIAGKREKLRQNLKPPFRYFVSAASAMSPELAAEIVENFPARVIQGYGLSESVNFSCLMPVDLGDEDYRHWMTSYERPSVGPALSGNEVTVVGQEGQELGELEKGEIVINGPSLMKGYRGDNQPRDSAPQGFRTGDVGFFQRDSAGRKFFFVTGRLKETIKRLGQTVSLLEVDDLVSRAPGLADRCIAVAFDHSISGEELGLVIKAQAAEEIRLPEVTEFIERTVPEYMRPRLIGYTAHSIRTASGKPRRWPFKAAFSAYGSEILGSRIQFIGEIAPEERAN